MSWNFCVPTCFHVRIPKPCLSVCPYPEKRNHHSFVNISPTLVIDTSMERSSRVLQHIKPIIWISSNGNYSCQKLAWIRTIVIVNILFCDVVCPQTIKIISYTHKILTTWNYLYHIHFIWYEFYTPHGEKGS